MARDARTDVSAWPPARMFGLASRRVRGRVYPGNLTHDGKAHWRLRYVPRDPVLPEAVTNE